MKLCALLLLLGVGVGCRTPEAKSLQPLAVRAREAGIKWQHHLEASLYRTTPAEERRVAIAFEEFKAAMCQAAVDPGKYQEAENATLNYVELVNLLVVEPVP